MEMFQPPASPPIILYEVPVDQTLICSWIISFSFSSSSEQKTLDLQVFQKGSPIAADVSKAILTLSERGILQSLEDKWFPSSDECSTTDTTELSLQNFWALYVLCGATSTICFLLFLCRLLLKYFQQNAPSESAWRRTVELANYIHKVEIKIPDRASDFSQGSNRASSSGSPGWVLVSPSDAPEPSEASPPTAIQMI